MPLEKLTFTTFFPFLAALILRFLHVYTSTLEAFSLHFLIFFSKLTECCVQPNVAVSPEPLIIPTHFDNRHRHDCRLVFLSLWPGSLSLSLSFCRLVFSPSSTRISSLLSLYRRFSPLAICFSVCSQFRHSLLTSFLFLLIFPGGGRGGGGGGPSLSVPPPLYILSVFSSSNLLSLTFSVNSHNHHHNKNTKTKKYLEQQQHNDNNNGNNKNNKSNNSNNKSSVNH